MPLVERPAFVGKIALVHDSLTQLGGAERVLDVLHDMFPSAPVFTLVLDKNLKEKYKYWDIRTSKLQKFYNFFPKLQYWLPFIASAVSSLNFEGFDVVLSSSSSFVKNITVPKSCKHICYCHTPTRFLWSEPEYVNAEVPFGLRTLAKVFLKKMKAWDYAGAQRVTTFLANSQEVQKRIKLYYGRESEVVYPFVNTNFWKPVDNDCHRELARALSGQRGDPGEQEIASEALAMTGKKDYFLLAGRLQSHKHNELIIQIFNELNLPLHVVGTGRQEEYLKSIAKENVKFLGRVSDEQLREEYSGALAYLYPQVEDFGLMPLEASACGTATLAYAKGGALETIVEGVTGEFFYSYDKQEIKKKILNWNVNKYLVKNLKVQAEKFSLEIFEKKLLSFVKLSN